MSVFIKFLVSLVAHMAWQRIGGKGPVPPVRLPKGGKTVNLPIIAPWQMMMVMWLFNKMWKQYGKQMKSHLLDNSHPVARRVGSFLPDVPDSNPAWAPAPAQTAAAAQTATPGQNPAPASTGATASAGTTAPKKSYGTQKLGAAPAGSLLSSLRGSQPASG